MKIKFIFIATIILLGVGAFVLNYLGYFQKSTLDRSGPTLVSERPRGTDRELSNQSLESVDPASYKIEEVVMGLEVPWSIAFTSEDRFLVTERSGAVRVVERGSLLDNPALVLSDVSSQAEEGLMGIVTHPNYDENQFVYLCYARSDNGGLSDRVVRFVDNGVELEQPTVILDNIPAARFHAGCELGFGPDDKLYITTGDATDKNIAQDLGSLGGKILRVNDDGSIPVDNPFENSPIWSYGHRNPQGIDWLLSEAGKTVMFEAEHGPSGFDGPGGGDEINIITKGSNYGWPVVSHEESAEGMVDPKLVYTPAIAPGSLMVYQGTTLPQFENNIFFAMLRGEGLTRVVVNPDDLTEVLMYERLPGIDFGRIREVVEGPDGNIYFTTSNTDGRGSVRDGDDKVYRIMP